MPIIRINDKCSMGSRLFLEIILVDADATVDMLNCTCWCDHLRGSIFIMRGHRIRNVGYVPKLSSVPN